MRARVSVCLFLHVECPFEMASVTRFHNDSIAFPHPCCRACHYQPCRAEEDGESESTSSSFGVDGWVTSAYLREKEATKNGKDYTPSSDDADGVVSKA